MTNNAFDSGGKKRDAWPWGSWFEEYYRTGEFPTAFGNAVMITFNSKKRWYPATFYGQEQEDRGQDVLLDTVDAIVHSKTLAKVYSAWNDRQLYGYVATIVENCIRLKRKSDHPAWFKMLQRLRRLARSKLKLVDERERAYIPIEWPGGEENWQIDPGLEALLIDVPVFEEKASNRIPEPLLEKAVHTLFAAARGPIPLKTLVAQCLRLLQVHEPVSDALLYFREASDDLKNTASEFPNATVDTIELTHCTHSLEMNIGEHVLEMLLPLSPLQLLAFYVREYQGRTLKESARILRTLLGRRTLSMETVRTHVAEAAKLMRDASWYPKTAVEEATLARLLVKHIEERLQASGFDLANSVQFAKLDHQTTY